MCAIDNNPRLLIFSLLANPLQFVYVIDKLDEEVISLCHVLSNFLKIITIFTHPTQLIQFIDIFGVDQACGLVD